MNDRELLELAAKAAGMQHKWNKDGLYVDAQTGVWNPLTDDGDALRLAVKMGISRVLELDFDPSGVCATFHHPVCGADEFQTPGTDFDPYAATRRAIVRAAAEIGKAKS